MKQTLLFAFCGIMAAGAAFAPPSAEVLSKACDLGKNVLVATEGGGETCVPKRPCRYDGYESYCKELNWSFPYDLQGGPFVRLLIERQGKKIDTIKLYDDTDYGVVTTDADGRMGYVYYKSALNPRYGVSSPYAFKMACELFGGTLKKVSSYGYCMDIGEEDCQEIKRFLTTYDWVYGGHDDIYMDRLDDVPACKFTRPY